MRTSRPSCSVQVVQFAFDDLGVNCNDSRLLGNSLNLSHSAHKTFVPKGNLKTLCSKVTSRRHVEWKYVASFRHFGTALKRDVIATASATLWILLQDKDNHVTVSPGLRRVQISTVKMNSYECHFSSGKQVKIFITVKKFQHPIYECSNIFSNGCHSCYA